MTTKFMQDAAAARYPQGEHQGECADATPEAVTRGLVDEKIAAGESSYAADSGAPIEDVFARLIAKYG